MFETSSKYSYLRMCFLRFEYGTQRNLNNVTFITLWLPNCIQKRTEEDHNIHPIRGVLNDLKTHGTHICRSLF